MINFESPLFRNFKVNNSFNKTLILSGSDAQDYLQRQLTSDIHSLRVGESQLSARLDKSGRVHSFFYLLKDEKSFYLLVNDSLENEIRDELEKFLFAEDVIVSSADPFNLYVGPSVQKSDSKVYSSLWCDMDACFSQDKLSDYDQLQESECDKFIYLTGWPILNKTQKVGELINNTRLNELAVSYSKGCFLGQETAAKIETRRGAAKFPAILCSSEKNIEVSNLNLNPSVSFEYDNKFYHYVNLAREFRVEKKKISENVTVKLLPALNLLDKRERAEEIFHEAISEFHNEKIDQALKLLDLSIEIDPGYSDAYETKGVILGQVGEFEKAIEEMDELLSVDPDSVMAHTNKSLYLMKMGKIEEAEEEKSLATLASFKKLGSESKKKKELEEAQKQKEADLKRKKEMFIQVLELDADDELANYGIADYYYYYEEYEKALTHVSKVVDNNEKYSVAYVLMGKIYEKQDDKQRAKSVYQKGIEIASKNGDMMPANEMQERLNSL